MALVASIYNLPPRVLPSIQAIEGGHVGTVSHNHDGSEDLGVMQINSLWIRSLALYTSRSEAEVRRRLIGDACYDIAAAGLILRTYLTEDHGNLMQAIGDYHSHTRMLNLDYRAKVMRAAETLFVSGHRR